MRSIAMILICAGCLTLCSCVWPSDFVREKPLPVTPQLADDVADVGPVVAAVEPKVDRKGLAKNPPILSPMGSPGEGLSREYVAPAEPVEEIPTFEDGQDVGPRAGRMVRNSDGQWRFVFQAGEGETHPPEPLTILPNPFLEEMEKIVAERGEQVIFHVSGQATRYRDSGYLMIYEAVVEADTDR